MVTITAGAYGVQTMEIYGLSTDSKPVDSVTNASVFYEMDTKKLFLFDAENQQWLEQ